jgi:hypothetical protein
MEVSLDIFNTRNRNFVNAASGTAGDIKTKMWDVVLTRSHQLGWDVWEDLMDDRY